MYTLNCIPQLFTMNRCTWEHITGTGMSTVQVYVYAYSRKLNGESAWCYTVMKDNYISTVKSCLFWAPLQAFRFGWWWGIWQEKLPWICRGIQSIRLRSAERRSLVTCYCLPCVDNMSCAQNWIEISQLTLYTRKIEIRVYCEWRNFHYIISTHVAVVPTTLISKRSV